MPRTIAMTILNNSESVTFDLDIVFQFSKRAAAAVYLLTTIRHGLATDRCITYQATRH